MYTYVHACSLQRLIEISYDYSGGVSAVLVMVSSQLEFGAATDVWADEGDTEYIADGCASCAYQIFRM